MSQSGQGLTLRSRYLSAQKKRERSMRVVHFRQRGAVGPYGKCAELPLDQFMLCVPGLIYLRRIPPHAVLNTFLLLGNADAGMSGGCKWPPFQVTQEEHAEAVKSLLASPAGIARRIRYEPVPSGTKSKLEWCAWALFSECGVPYVEHLQLLEAEEALRALNDGDSEHAHLEWIAAATKLSEFVHPYLQRNRDAAR